jgi:hypothetical protein
MKKILSLLAAFAFGTLLFASPASAQSATITLIHGIPDTDVDVVVGGEAVFEGFSFGQTQDLSSFAGQTLPGVQVVVAGTDTVAIDAGDVALPASGNFSVIAHLDADGNPALGVFENDTSAIAAGQGRIVVRHAAAAPAVDILANGDVAFANVANGAEGSADLAAGTISVSVVPAGATEPVVIGPADIPVTEGTSLIVYAVGSLDDGTLTVLDQSITDLGSAPTAVNTGNSPIAADSNNAAPIFFVAAGAAALIAGIFGTRRFAAARN